MKFFYLIILAFYSVSLQALSQSETIIAPRENHGVVTTLSNKINLKKQQLNKLLDKITPSKDSALHRKLQKENKIRKNPLSIMLYRPTYILPFYYTVHPDYKVYENNTPNEQRIMREEFKSQLSFSVPIMYNFLFNKHQTLKIAYTQLNFWQVYASSQYFRETNYEPEIFLENNFHRNWLFRAGINHQSNGRGGLLERSWNRVIESVEFSGENWLVLINGWQLVFQGESSNLHNPDIAHYLGYENIVLSSEFKKLKASVQLENLESGLHRGSVMLTLSYPITDRVSLYAQGFSGYGQSLIEYNHYTSAAGLGIAFNDWI